MKKILGMVLMICLLLVVPFANNASLSSVYAADKNTVIILEGAKQSEKQVTVDVTVKENSGIYSMLLGIEYDNTVMTLTNVEHGTALQSLEPLASGSYSVYPYKVTYLGTNDENDYSTGKLMTLTFTIKENVPDGKYLVKLAYEKNKDVTYLQNKDFPTKNLVVNDVEVTLLENKVENVTTVENNNSATIMWILVGVSIGLVIIAIVTTVVILRKKKGKWVKLW